MKCAIASQTEGYFFPLVAERWPSDPSVTVMALVLVVLISFGFLIWSLRRRYIQESRLRSEIEDEEKRMFSFLRGLGHAVEEDMSAHRLNQIIVKGVNEVLNAGGSGIYLMDSESKLLRPEFLSKNCPALIPVQEDILEKAKDDQRVLSSYLRLTRVDADKGLFGKVLLSDRPQWIKDVFADPSLAGEKDGNPSEVEAMIATLRHGGTVLGVLFAANLKTDGSFTDNDFEVFRSISEQTAFALGNAIAHQEAAAKRLLDREIQTASEVQRILLPDVSPDFEGYRIGGRNVPARVISGDYFDYIPLSDGHLAVVIGDVSGKGIPAGMLMAMCRSVLRSVADKSRVPGELLSKVNRQLFPDIKEDMFISMAVVVLDARSNRVTLARAGHDAPLLFRKAEGDEADENTGTIEEIRSKGLAVGIDEGDVFERSIENFEFEMAEGDCLLLYTDGITEAEDRSGFEFGKQEMLDAFKEGASQGGLVALGRIESDVEAFVGEHLQTDDMTMVTIERR